MLATMQSTVIVAAKVFLLFITLLFELFLCDLLTCSNAHRNKLVTSKPIKYVLWVLEVANPKKGRHIEDYDSAQLSKLRLFLS